MNLLSEASLKLEIFQYLTNRDQRLHAIKNLRQQK